MQLAVVGVVEVGESDLDLVERHRQGDETAFGEVYGRFSSLVFNIALRMSGEAETAADLSQEVFLRVYRHLGGFKGRSSLKTWIYRVAVNCCRSRLKRRGKRRQREAPEPEDGLGQVPDPSRGPEDRALAADARRSVERALAELPLAFREAVVLRDIEGLSYEEIAAALGVRLGTVRSRIARGRDRLRAVLEAS